ncbi:hypothetical protein CT0861_00366 [Colletotrichum tofieldiae]|uniref:Uncharacterized protein n=1 Tax=Colletotrichum tofieldiae TaxID=708197 RepID=A0A166Q5Y6_9PEZI|nr:hypothetical protein CT0861_00366 [Colletotrichum tofieldiae]
MTPLNQGPLKKRDRTNENFDKATKNLMSRCDQIRQRYGADVYIQVRRKHKHYQYTSSNEPSWPKTKAEMETTYPVPVTRTPPDFASRRSRVPTGCPSSTTCGPRGTAAEGSDAQHQDGSSEVDSQKVPVHVDAYHPGDSMRLEETPDGGCRTVVHGKSPE